MRHGMHHLPKCVFVVSNVRQTHQNMKKLMVVLCILLFYHAKAQVQNQHHENPGTYFNAFQKHLYDKPNEDSALYCVQKLASNSRYAFLLKELLHNSFSQEFRQKNKESTDTSEINAFNQRLLFSKSLLLKMVSDTNRVLQEAARPIYLFTKAQEDSSNSLALRHLTNDFLSKELSSGDIYGNRQGRYGLLIHSIISKHETLNPLAEKLLLTIRSNLKSYQVKLTDATSRTELDKRAWYRYLYAYVNHLEATNTTDSRKKTLLLKTAFDFSPDLVDRNHSAAYFYDMIFLVGGKNEGFQEDYLNFLANNSKDKQVVLTALLEAALTVPEYRDRLKAYYNINNSSGTSFKKYWTKAINKKAKAAPSISLRLLDGKPFLSKNLMGKWVMLDFWGTWCAPCRAEHPDLEKFYQTTIRENSNIISLLAVACKDSYDKVSAYMEQKKYTFPVAMSDNKIENLYSVQGYPTKVLITPEGKYIVVPFGADWVSFVKQYSGL